MGVRICNFANDESRFLQKLYRILDAEQGVLDTAWRHGFRAIRGGDVRLRVLVGLEALSCKTELGQNPGATNEALKHLTNSVGLRTTMDTACPKTAASTDANECMLPETCREQWKGTSFYESGE